MTLKSFVLFASHDGEPRDANYRGFSRFTLFVKDSGGAFQPVFEIYPALFYGDTPVPPNATIGTNDYGNRMILCANIDSIEGQQFRAEFVQYGAPSNASGPRIVELDGFESSCPGADADNDDVVDDDDLCPDTLPSEVVNPDGCSIAQLCPCEGPLGSTDQWKSHGKYVSCTAKTSETFIDLGLISNLEKDVIVSEASESNCGAKH